MRETKPAAGEEKRDASRRGAKARAGRDGDAPASRSASTSTPAPASRREREEGRSASGDERGGEQQGKGQRDNGRGDETAAERTSLAATLTPLLIGFALLIALVIGLGYLSSRQLHDLTMRTLDNEQQLVGRFKVLLNLEVALTKLDNEARARARVEGNRGLLPPLNLPLRNARREVDEALEGFTHLPLAESEKGSALRRDVGAYLETTENLDSYSLKGFEAFARVNRTLDELLADAKREQDAIPAMLEQSREAARGNIFFVTMLAVLTGTIVAVGTIWEVQRRFRQIRRNLDALRRERQFSTQILKGMVSAIVAVDRQDRIRSANDAFFRVFPAARIGASIHDDFAAPEATRMLSAAVATRVRTSTYKGRWPLAQGTDGADGEETTFDVYASPLEIEGEPGQLLTLVDVTDAVNAESDLRRQESLAAVGRAAAQVAHEIKNPLGSIRLGVAMLRDMTGSAEAISTIDLVERGIDHLNKLTLDVTQFSRQRQLSFSQVDLHELLDASLDLVADKIRDKQTPVERAYNSAPVRLEADADQLRQVFVNLFANAIDASPTGAPLRISTEQISARRSDRGSSGGVAGNGESGALVSFARVRIEDRGSGIDELTRARIFEPFFTTKKRGTGLGLAIAKQIVEQHGGRISVESTPGRGTQFNVDLPLNLNAA